MRARVWKRNVGAARLREFRIQIDRVAHVDDNKEWRPRFAAGERAGILLGLATYAEERVVPCRGAEVPWPFLRRLLRSWAAVDKSCSSS